jgi:hypothetical protein
MRIPRVAGIFLDPVSSTRIAVTTNTGKDRAAVMQDPVLLQTPGCHGQ